MPVASVMAESAKPEKIDEPGAPIARDAIDPDLIKLARARPKIGIITAAGLVFLSAYFLARINPDRRFSGHGNTPSAVHVSDIVDGKVDRDAYIALDDAVPLVSHAVRASTSKGSLGLRVVPVRGTGEKLWLVLSGDGWDPPADHGYVGRLRALGDLPLASVVRELAVTKPRPVFAPASAVRAGFTSGKITTVTGDTIDLDSNDRVAFDVVDPDAATLTCTLNERLPTVQAWTAALAEAGIAAGAPTTTTDDQLKLSVAEPNAIATITARLEHAKLWAARVDPVTRHYDTTWGALRGSSPAGLTVDHTTIPDSELDLIGLYVATAVPSDAYALVTDEQPDQYWYVLPVTIAVAAICLVFAWALVRAVKRDLLPTHAPRIDADPAA
jgi:hypothetical protein